ncbi:MAG: HAMP domain-containing histidine kinase [Lachnospiraceae bacterium]|nr:HAMP domain-containing histidine kinase [Lachnospiraceae bacterium]
MLTKLRRIVKSIRFHILILLLLVGLIPLIAVSGVITRRYYHREVQDRMVAIQSECLTLGKQIVSDGYFQTQSPRLTSRIQTFAELYDGRIMVINSSYKIVTDTYQITQGKVTISPEVIEAFSGTPYSHIDMDGLYLEYLCPIYETAQSDASQVGGAASNSAESPNVVGVIVVCSSLQSLEDRYSSNRQSTDFLVMAFALGVLISAFLFIFWVGHPFRKIKTKIEMVREGNLEVDLAHGGYTELSDLGIGYQGAIEALRETDRSRQQFVSDVSHELKTPITSIKILVDSLLGQENAPHELYKEFLSDIGSEIDRENDIINDLLALSRMDRGTVELNIKTTNINDSVESLLKRLTPIATAKGVELTFETFRTIMADVDEVKFTLALMNIVENAIKYNVENGSVSVSLNADHVYFYVSVKDTGIGIAKEDCEKIFERFYRADKARSRDTGGTGLGLALSKRIVQLHKGTINVSSEIGKGSEFRIRIPLVFRKGYYEETEE